MPPHGCGEDKLCEKRCYICFDDEETASNPLRCDCDCANSYAHIDCLVVFASKKWNEMTDACPSQTMDFIFDSRGTEIEPWEECSICHQQFSDITRSRLLSAMADKYDRKNVSTAWRTRALTLITYALLECNYLAKARVFANKAITIHRLEVEQARRKYGEESSQAKMCKNNLAQVIAWAINLRTVNYCDYKSDIAPLVREVKELVSSESEKQGMIYLYNQKLMKIQEENELLQRTEEEGIMVKQMLEDLVKDLERL